MSGFSDQYRAPLRKERSSMVNIAVIAGISLLAILFRVYVSRFVPYLQYLELPLLVTVYFSLMWRSPIAGVLFGATVGLAQDSLSHHLLGMFGIVKTLVGYFAASVSLRVDVGNPLLRLVLGFFFFFFHQLLYWVMARAMLGEALDFEAPQALVLAMLNAIVAVFLYQLLDRLKVTG
ncbi:MAG TPA: rod shape-determining protein MreD [Bryobacteraceae bacterium]|nr:rod shape-determining protein MreD [Bryobacteraceae bacterium]